MQIETVKSREWGLCQGWHISLPIYRHFWKYRLSVSVKVRTDKISVIGYQLLPSIGSEYRLNFGVFTPGKKKMYRQFLEYRLSVSVKPRTD